MDRADLVREYYRAIDDGDYAALTDALAGGFVHRRPDTTIEGREEFVSFMRSGRPETDTEHELEAVIVPGADADPDADADWDSGTDTDEAGDRVAVEGRLLRADGSEWFRFVDVFTVRGGRICELRTYTH